MNRSILVLLCCLSYGACQPYAETTLDLDAVFGGSAGEWVDLTYAYSEDAIYWPTAQGFTLEEVAYGDTEGGWFYSSYNYSASEHGGTHFDAPIHFARGADTNEKVPLRRFIGAAAVIDVAEKAAPDYLVSVEDLLAWESRHGPLPDGVILLLRTGWGERWPDPLRYLGTELTGPEAVPGPAPVRSPRGLRAEKLNPVPPPLWWIRAVCLSVSKMEGMVSWTGKTKQALSCPSGSPAFIRVGEFGRKSPRDISSQNRSSQRERSWSSARAICLATLRNMASGSSASSPALFLFR